MKKTLFYAGLLLALLGWSCSGKSSAEDAASGAHEHHQSAPAAGESGSKKPLSPRTAAMANIGDTHVHVDYSSPSVRGRAVWGGLVAYDQVWVTGAHKATSIDFSQDVRINGQTIPAGTYGFFTIPGKEEWVLILNKNHEQHLADDYDPAQDVLRMTVRPESLSEPVEALTYEVVPGEGKKGRVSVSWDRLRVGFDVEEL